MLTFSLKEQLIYLALHHTPYKVRWHYVQLSMKQVTSTEQECRHYIKELIMRHFLSEDSLLFLKIQDDELHLIRELSKKAIAIGEANYPPLWLEIPKPPLVIYYRGHLSLLNKPLVSIIGTRKITSYGKEVTQALTQAIVREGWGVVSGLATGVDQIAHETAIAEKVQSTIAIIPTGVDHYYPPQNRKLQDELCRNHLVLSEYLPFERAKKHHFIMRNRLVAGLTTSTIVMEAAMKSGSLITANYAIQFDREVHALPGRMNDTTSQGCNDLIAQGAYPITSISNTISILKQHFLNHHFI